MQAKHHIQESRAQQAQAARLLLQANRAYGESNSSGLSHIQRLQARQECRVYLEEVIALEPNSAIALGLLGRVEMDDGQLENAHDLFNASLEAQPDQAQQYANLGYWALKTERPALAEQHFLQALDCDRQSAAAFAVSPTPSDCKASLMSHTCTIASCWKPARSGIPCTAACLPALNTSA